MKAVKNKPRSLSPKRIGLTMLMGARVCVRMCTCVRTCAYVLNRLEFVQCAVWSNMISFQGFLIILLIDFTRLQTHTHRCILVCKGGNNGNLPRLSNVCIHYVSSDYCLLNFRIMNYNAKQQQRNSLQ